MKRDEFDDDPAAQAFHELRAEVTVTRKDVAALHDQIEANRPPDYGVDLAQMKQVIAHLAKQIEVLGDRPVLSMMPEEHGQRIAYAGADATRNAVAALVRAQQNFEQQRNVLGQWVAEARTAQMQGWWLLGVSLASFAFGMVVAFWAVTRI